MLSLTVPWADLGSAYEYPGSLAGWLRAIGYTCVLNGYKVDSSLDVTCLNGLLLMSEWHQLLLMSEGAGVKAQILL